MTTADIQTIAGYQIPWLAAQLANLAAQGRRAESGLTGYYDGAPTLAREAYGASRADAERQYTLDVARFGLQQAQLNFQQRMAEADAKMQELSLLASQRGPSNALAYNYLLSNGVVPEGRAAGGSSISTGINQPYTGAPGAIAMPAAVKPADSTPYYIDGVQQASNPFGTSPSGAWYSASQGEFDRMAQVAENSQAAMTQGPDSTPGFDLAPGGGVSLNATEIANGAQWQPAPMNEDGTYKYARGGMSIRLPRYAEGGADEEREYAEEGAENIAFDVIDTVVKGLRSRHKSMGVDKMASGGIRMGRPVITGDSTDGRPNEEMTAPVMSPGGELGVAVMPTDKMEESAESPAFNEGYDAMMAGQPDQQRMQSDKEYLAGVMACQADSEQQAMPKAAQGGWLTRAENPKPLTEQLDWLDVPQRPREIPPRPLYMERYAEGGFSNTVYDPEDFANAPTIQKLTGALGTGFGGDALDYSIPGTQTSLPAANRANITTLSRLLPSELGFAQGVVETPRDMGGLGLDWQDYIAGARRAAPTGASFSGATVYG